MNFKLSVCIVSNIIDNELHRSVQSFEHPLFEICVGFNGLDTEVINDFADRYPAIKVFDILWSGYGNTKNELAEKASSDWILSIDSDEIADDELIKALLGADLSDAKEVFALQRIQKIGQHQIRYGSFGAEWKVRLYNREALCWNQEKVHEELILDKSYRVSSLNGVLWHLTSGSIQEVKLKNDHYALLSAQNMLLKGKKANALKPLMAAAMAFMKQYFLKKGILDGTVGLLLAKESARYTFLKYFNLRKMDKNG